MTGSLSPHKRITWKGVAPNSYPFVTLVRGPIVSAVRGFNNEAVPAIGLAYIAGSVSALGYNCTIVDAIAEGLNQVHPIGQRPEFVTHGLSIDELVSRIPDHSDVLGFSAMFSGEWPVLRDLIKQVRQRLPDALFVAGGEHITALPEYSLRDCPEIDIVIKGEGENIFVELLEAYRLHRDISKISGICFIDEEDDFHDETGLQRTRKIDHLPWPEWPDGYLEKFWNQRKSFGVQTAKDMPILASRGCPYQCTFCSSPAMWTTRYILRDIDDLIAEIESYQGRFGITALQFYDLTAITKKRWILEFGKRLKEAGIQLKWSLPSGTRSEVLDKETLTLLRDTHCNYLVYAPESGSPRTLQKVKKRIDLKRITASMKTAKKLGLTIRANLIIGFPHENRGDVFRTILYGLRLVIMGVDEVPLFLFSSYPGSELFREQVADGTIFIDDDYFFGLASLNSDFSNLRPKIFTSNITPLELGIYRSSFMLLNYLVSYMLYPRRILRTIRNVYGRDNSNQAATVLEHRIRDWLDRREGDRKTMSVIK